MKKFCSMILLVVFLLGICGCAKPAGQSDSSNDSVGESTGGEAVSGGKTGLLVGYGKGDITPTESVPLQGVGYAGDKMSTGFSTYLHAICIAVTDDAGNTAVMMSVDACSIVNYLEELRLWVMSEYGIKPENFIISAIHQHTTPHPGLPEIPSSRSYYSMAIQAMKDAIDQAMEDRAPAQMYINTVETQGLNFVRNYIANDPAGSIVSDNHNDEIGKTYGYKCHEAEPDNLMQLLKFVRGEEKTPIILVNFQGHPHMGIESKSAHADWPAIMREEVEKALGANVIYFSGAGGNVSSNSRIKGELPYANNDFRSHGKRAAEYVIGAEGSYREVGTGRVAARSLTNTYSVNHVDEAHLLSPAIEILDAEKISTEEANQVLAKYPEIFSVYHAKYIEIRSNLGDTLELTIGAISIGDVAFTYHTYEMFDVNGMELKGGTIGNTNYSQENQHENPYAMTIVTTMANGAEGYIPSQLGYINGGYSTDITRFAPGTGEELVTDYLEILNELHGS